MSSRELGGGFVPSSGACPPVPVAFGNYELGRSGWPGHESAAQESAWSRDGLIKGLKTELSGDPGHYNPYLYSNLFRTKRTSKVRRAFDSTHPRDMKLFYGETDSPGCMKYNAAADQKKLYPRVASNEYSFRSRSLQRPSSIIRTPGAGTYTPNFMSVHEKVQDSGAGMRSKGNRFGNYKECMTDEYIGPGYYDQLDGSLYVEAQKLSSRSSKKRPGFGSSSAQRALPLSARGGAAHPGPGYSQPLQPRIKELMRTPRSARGSGTPRVLGTPRSSSGFFSARGPATASV